MVVGSGRMPTFSDRSALPYVNAVVKEVLRWNAVIPLCMLMGAPYLCFYIHWKSGVIFLRLTSRCTRGWHIFGICNSEGGIGIFQHLVRISYLLIIGGVLLYWMPVWNGRLSISSSRPWNNRISSQSHDRQIMHDPKNYHDPFTFKPEHFLTADGHAPEMDLQDVCFGYGCRYVLTQHFIFLFFWSSRRPCFPLIADFLSLSYQQYMSR